MIHDEADLDRRARVLLASDRVTAPTQRALLARLDAAPAPTRTFDARRLAVLAAAAARLTPFPGLEARLDLAARLDAMLADEPGDGWRYADSPPDVELHRAGLDGLDSAAQALRGAGFVELDDAGRDAILAAAQKGEPLGPPWAAPPARWFEEVLAALTELAYGHPLVQVAIGYDGMADARGWQGGALAPSAP